MASKRPPQQQPKPAAARPAGGPRPVAADKVAQIQQVIEVMVRHGAVEVELEEGSSRIRVRLKEERPQVTYAGPAAMAPAAAPVAGGSAPAAVSVPTPGGARAAPAGEVFKSPMLGTFYRQASPEAESFVKVGDRVKADTTLCIIEAMKVMNEIKAEREFEVLDVLVRNGDPVEYGQPLFLIRS
jgi:acetyl-CoA carboxylase biotin carboxyl carrier protein